MKSSSSAAPRNSNTNHPPLARNAQGHPVEMPDGAVWWQLKRETRGRPSLIKGPDGQPVRVPLDKTKQDVLETWGAGTFRLDALDALGNVLDYVTTVEIRDDESSDDDDERDVDARDVSDLRYTLQTLSQVTRANADAIRAVTEAQADWVKGLAANKSLPRHPMYLPAPGPAASDDRDEDDDDDGGHRNAGEPEGPPPPPAPTQPEWVTLVATNLGAALAPAVEKLVSSWAARFGGSPGAPGTPSPPVEPPSPAAAPTPPPVTPNPMIHLAAIHAGLSEDERDFLGDVLRSSRGERMTAELLALSVDKAVELVIEAVAQVRADHERARTDTRARDDIDGRRRARAERRGPEATTARVAPKAESTPATAAEGFMSRLLAVSVRLDADQRAEVLALLPRLAPERVEQLKAQLLAMTVEDAVAWIRENLPALRAEVEP